MTTNHKENAMNETTAAYRQMIADGHQPTAQDVSTLCDLMETAQEERDILRSSLERSEKDSKVLRDGLPGLAELFQAEPPEGRNYTEFSVSHEYPDGSSAEFVIEIIRKDRKTPHELRREAESERDQLRAELSRLRSAPVAGEVPEIPFVEYNRRVHSPELLSAWFRANIRAIPLSRILKDGERAVPVALLNDAIERLLDLTGWVRDSTDSPHIDLEAVTERIVNALRSGEAEGRRG